MARGRKPQPTRLKILRGCPGKRPLNPLEPQPAPGVPDPPPHLDAEALAEWHRTAAALGPAGVITQADRATLAAYCQCWSRVVKLEKAVQQTGEVLSRKDKSGYFVNPYLKALDKAYVQLRGFATEFGLSPASRAKVVAVPAREENPLEAILSGRAGA